MSALPFLVHNIDRSVGVNLLAALAAPAAPLIAAAPTDSEHRPVRNRIGKSGIFVNRCCVAGRRNPGY
jgi:hypothetical protein